MKKLFLENAIESAIIDEEDYFKVANFKWHKHSMGYAVTYDSLGNTIFLHRLILIFAKVDHIDRNRLNYRKINLRPCTESQNKCNRVFKPGISGYIGVDWCKPMKKWRARLKRCGMEFLGGYFDTKEEAALAYNKLALDHYGEFANINNVEVQDG